MDFGFYINYINCLPPQLPMWRPHWCWSWQTCQSIGALPTNHTSRVRCYYHIRLHLGIYIFMFIQCSIKHSRQDLIWRTKRMASTGFTGFIKMCRSHWQRQWQLLVRWGCTKHCGFVPQTDQYHVCHVSDVPLLFCLILFDTVNVKLTHSKIGCHMIHNALLIHSYFYRFFTHH